MANEIWPSLDGIDVGGGVRQDINKVTEEAVRRVQENQKKAKQAQQQIQKDKQTNAKFAEFLTFLLRTLNNETLISSLYETFFKTKHPKTDITYLRKAINTIVIVGIFAPFFPKEIENMWLKTMFDPLMSFTTKPNLDQYLSYLKALSKSYHDNIPVDKTAFMEFLSEVLWEFWYIDKQKLSSEQKKDLQTWLQKELYGK